MSNLKPNNGFTVTTLPKRTFVGLCHATLILLSLNLYGDWDYRVKPSDDLHHNDVSVDSVNQIIKNYLVVSGSREILEGKKALKMSGKSKTAWDKMIAVDYSDYEVLFAPPNKGYLKISFYKRGATRTIYEIYDGTFVWSLSHIFGDPKVENYKVGDRARMAMKILPALIFVDPNLQPDWVIYHGKDFLNDREVYKVEFGYLSLENIQFFFDAKTFLLMEVRSRGELSEGGAIIDWKYRLLRYEKQGESYLPGYCESYGGSSILESVEFTGFQFLDTWDEAIFNTRKLRTR